MANLRIPPHDIFNRPGDEGEAPKNIDAQAEEHKNDIPVPSHDHIHSPGSEGSSGLELCDQGLRQGYRCESLDQKVPDYVGKGGPDPRRTQQAPETGSDPFPEMPGAKPRGK